MQGEFHVTEDDTVMLTTILGSCVSACMRDPLARVGGMNHFLLPGTAQVGASEGGLSHGVHAMELLVNGLLQHGAKRDRLEAKLFGGGVILAGLSDVGARNADFAERFLRKERIALVGGSLRGARGRRIEFWPVSGRARQMTLDQGEARVFASERIVKAAASDAGSVDFF